MRCFGPKTLSLKGRPTSVTIASQIEGEHECDVGSSYPVFSADVSLAQGLSSPLLEVPSPQPKIACRDGNP